jgi:dTDP-4-amino-4,6-dideoxy-D-galactose acyltransferase
MAGLLPAERAADLSGLGFLHSQRPALADHVNESLAQSVDEGRIHVAGVDARWYWRQLEWDSAYFGVPMIRLESAAWDTALGDPVEELARVAAGFRAETKAAHGSYYMFAELPATDCEPLQALGLSGFRLVETRLTYFVPDTSAFYWPEHYPVRTAELGDMPHLRDVAASARNRYDRYHADSFFGNTIADRYLATYAEESVKGLADFIVVPDPGDGAPPGGFFTVKIEEPSRCPFGRDHVCPLDMGVGRIPLVAVGAARSGWHLRLLVETTRMLATRSVRVACMTTQATNRAVVRNCEKVGYGLGRVTHILAASHGEAR